jgi:hypothetical protein
MWTHVIWQSGILVIILTMGAAVSAQAQMWINEIYLDPPSSLDSTREYIEIRGTAGASLADHYLIVLENETSATANPGAIEAIFDLGALTSPTLGSNGFLTLRQAGNPYTNFNPASNNLQNTGVAATWGSGAFSSIGFTDENNDGILENSGGTFMLIKNNGGALSMPTITSPNLIDLDVDDDNELDDSVYLQNWTILDSIGINSESSDTNGVLYAPINFSSGTPTDGGNIPSGATFVDVGFEIEFFARWGNSTGSAAQDWHISNLTNDPASGFDGSADFRQSGSPHGTSVANQYVESNQGVPYGTILTGDLGDENVFIADGDFTATYDGEEYVFDGKVNGRDFLLWQRNFGYGLNSASTPRFANRRHGDANGDRVVDGADLAIWQANYGAGSQLLAGAIAVPEPSSLALIMLSGLLFAYRSRR